LLSLVPPRLSRRLTRIAALSCLAVLGSAGAASAACPVRPTTTPFANWGDNSSYFPVPGGSFEGSAGEVGWTLSNATLTAGNEPFEVNASTDSQALTINGGGSATSPYFCVDNTMSSLRLFAQQVSGGGDLQIQAVVQTANGNGNGTTTLPLGTIADGTIPSWAPTQPINGSTSSTLMVALRFAVPAAAASWQIDDVYVDPYRAG
jgi:hypothetical protein